MKHPPTQIMDDLARISSRNSSAARSTTNPDTHESALQAPIARHSGAGSSSLLDVVSDYACAVRAPRGPTWRTPVACAKREYSGLEGRCRDHVPSMVRSGCDQLRCHCCLAASSRRLPAKVGVVRPHTKTDFWVHAYEVGFDSECHPSWARCSRSALTANGVTVSQLGASIVVRYRVRARLDVHGRLDAHCLRNLDVLDGEMARRQGLAGPRGAFIDSVVDRYGESAVFVWSRGLLSRPVGALGSRGRWAGGFLVSYTRARAESLGIDCRAGLLQRPERYVILGGVSMVSTVAGHLACDMSGRHGLVALGICVLAVLSNATALQRARVAIRRLA